MTTPKSHSSHTKDSQAGGKKTSPSAQYPTDPPPAAVQEQIRRGGPPADDPSRAPAPESRTPATENDRLIDQERSRQHDAKATKEQTEPED
jgi:hypothetical protein